MDLPGLKPIGRMAVFYLPSGAAAKAGVRERVEKFLIENFEGFTCHHVIGIGAWKDARGEVRFDSNTRYEVSFAGKQRIPLLVGFLRDLCGDLKEEALYLTMGEDSFLVLP